MDKKVQYLCPEGHRSYLPQEGVLPFDVICEDCLKNQIINRAKLVLEVLHEPTEPVASSLRANQALTEAHQVVRPDSEDGDTTGD